MTIKWDKSLLLCISLALLAGCSSNDNDNNEPSNQATAATPSDRLTLSPEGIGPINATTPFNIHLATQAFHGLNVSQQTSFKEGEAYPVIRVAKGAKTLFSINPTADHNGIYSVVIEDNLVHNSLGHRLSTKFSSIYTYGQVEKCMAGREELSGKTICYAPQMRNILYIFTGKWDGPDSEIPPEDVLASWTLDSIIWKPSK